jgi:hypothetical protein
MATTPASPVRILARAVDVAVAERDVAGLVEAVVRRQVLLGAELGGAVGRQRTPRGVLVCRSVALAVDRSPGRGEGDLRAVAAGGLEHVDRPEHIDFGVEVRPLDGDAHVRLRSEVEADLRPGVGEGFLRGRDVRFDQPCAPVDVLAPTGGEVVEDGDLVPAGDERIYDVRADEARAACHDRPHGPLS